MTIVQVSVLPLACVALKNQCLTLGAQSNHTQKLEMKILQSKMNRGIKSISETLLFQEAHLHLFTHTHICILGLCIAPFLAVILLSQELFFSCIHLKVEWYRRKHGKSFHLLVYLPNVHTDQSLHGPKAEQCMIACRGQLLKVSYKYIF